MTDSDAIMARILLSHDNSLAKAQRLYIPILHDAIENSHCYLAKELAEAGADVNETTSWSVMPLHYAAIEGCGSCVRMLIAHDADVNTLTETGKTALMIAAERNHIHIAKMLIAEGNAKIDIAMTPRPGSWLSNKGKQSATALDMAKSDEMYSFLPGAVNMTQGCKKPLTRWFGF